MKSNKRLQALVSGVVLIAFLCMAMPLNTMISQKSTSKRRMSRPIIKQIKPERYKNKLIWVRTSDKVRMELPEWQIDQMKAVQHKGAGTQYHWVDASMITSDELTLVQQALNVTDNLEQFRKFYTNLSQDQKENLINSASKLEMQGLTSLLMEYVLPEEVQKQIGATLEQEKGIIAPVVEYLKKKQIIKNQILKGHNQLVGCVAYSPDGNYIVSGSDNFILWNGRTGEQIKISKRYPALVSCMAYSPDGNYMVSGFTSGFLILSNGKTGEQIEFIYGHNKLVSCVAYSPDGNYIVSGSWDNNLILWNGKTGKRIKILEGHNSKINCVAYSPDGNYIISGSNDASLILWDGKTGEQIKTLKGHNSSVLCVAYSSNGDYMVSGSTDKSLILWNGKTGEQIRTVKGHNGWILCVKYSFDGNYIVSGAGGNDNNLILWNGKTGEQIRVLKGHRRNVTCVAYSPDGNYIISGSGSSDNNLILWNGESGEQIRIFNEHYGDVNCVAWNTDSNYIVSGADGNHKNLILWKLIEQKMIDYIATQLNLVQARFLYRLYQAQINKVPVILDSKDADYQIYLTLPQDVQKIVKVFLPFELASDIIEKAAQEKSDLIEKVMQEKMKEYRASLFYSNSYFFGKSEKTRDQKIEALKNVMQKLEKDSIDYKACLKLLDELELEAAFEM